MLKWDNVVFGYKKRYKPIIENFTYEMRAGVTVLLGPNGAGKSTLLGLASSALSPWSGRVLAGERDASQRGDRRAYRAAVGWVPQQVQVIPAFSVREQVAYFGWLKGYGRHEAWDRAGTALEKLRLADAASARVGRLSGGQLRRVGVAQALVHDASVILMDEPTAGLDPAQRAGFRDLVREVGEFADVMISTHQTEDLAEIAQSVLLIGDGSIRWDGSLPDFLGLADGASASQQAEAAYVRLLGSGL